MSGQDILDQAAGTTPFVHDYLHITWDGTETQNDKATTTSPVSPAIRSPGCRPRSARYRSITLCSEPRSRTGSRRTAGPGRVYRQHGRDRRTHVQQCNVQGRLPRLPVRGVRNGSPEGRPDDPDIRLLRAVVARASTQHERRAALAAPSRSGQSEFPTPFGVATAPEGVLHFNTGAPRLAPGHAEGSKHAVLEGGRSLSVSEGTYTGSLAAVSRCGRPKGEFE